YCGWIIRFWVRCAPGGLPAALFTARWPRPGRRVFRRAGPREEPAARRHHQRHGDAGLASLPVRHPDRRRLGRDAHRRLGRVARRDAAPFARRHRRRLRDRSVRAGPAALEFSMPQIHICEVGPFVPTKLIPAMADTAEVLKDALSIPGLKVVALAPNLKGFQRAIEAGAHKVTFPVSASRQHSESNVRMTPEQMVEEVRKCA